MNKLDCPTVRDLLPELLLGALEPDRGGEVRKHLSSCPECREEAGLLHAVLRARPEPPGELQGRIQARLRTEMAGGGARLGRSGDAGVRGRRGGVVVLLFGGRFRIPSAVLPAAAVLVLALGTSIFLSRGLPDVEQEPIQVVLADEPLPEAYLWDDGVVAGAPIFDDLSEEDLQTLLAELEGEP